jgi:putative ABC transport system substrate-binding protein
LALRFLARLYRRSADRHRSVPGSGNILTEIHRAILWSILSPERDDLVREIARNLVRENVDVIVTPGTQVTRAVKQETNSIPIVMVAVGDPVGVGLVASLARPGGNITGLSNMMSDVAGKRLEILKEIAPDATRIAILFNPANAGNVLDVKATEAAARTMGVTTHSLEVRAPSDFVNAFSSMTRERDNALFVSNLPTARTKDGR